MKSRFWRSLLAVLAGNAIYFAVERFLPLNMQHRQAADLGLAVDFVICILCYWIVKLVW